MILLVIMCILLLVAILVKRLKRCYRYWERRDVYSITPKFPFGNVTNPFTRSVPFYIEFEKYYIHFKELNLKHAGIYMGISPTYVPIDPSIIKLILRKDFNHFTDRGIYSNEKSDPLSVQLFSLEGSKWKNLRAKMAPAFSSGKMRKMFQSLVDCAEPMRQTLMDQIKGPIDIKEIMACYTTDVIGSVAFGLECNSFQEPNAPFRMFGKKIFNRTKWSNLKILFTSSFAGLAKFLGFTSIDSEVSKFFLRVVKSNVTYRKTNNIRRNDFMQILIDLKENENALTIEEICAQAFLFFSAGFETSSTTMQFCLYELARNPHMQEKARKEVNRVLEKYDGNFSIESINEMKYMKQLINETLRMYPVAPILIRVCTKTYHVPGTDLILEKGTKVNIPVLGLHMDEEYFPDPKRFNPERFAPDQKVPFMHLAFGDGPRNCIGKQFGMLQVKVGLATILNKFKIELNEKTPTPLELDTNAFVYTTKSTIYLNMEPINLHQ